MEIFFKDAYGNRVGFINGNDIRDTNGNRVGFINGNDIKDSGGNRIGCLNGNDLKDAYGNRVGFINGDDIKDSGGNRVGYAEGGASDIEMCAAAFLLLNLRYGSGSSGTSSYGGSAPVQREKPEGCLGWLFFIIVGYFMFLLKSNWGGKIGLIIGGVITILLFIMERDMPYGNYVLFGIFIPLFLGTIGAIIGAIAKFIKKLADKNN